MPEASPRSPTATGPRPVRLLVSMGDPAGIGPEIILAAWRNRHALPGQVMAVYGDAETFAERARNTGKPVPVVEVTHPSEADRVHPEALAVLPSAPRDVFVGVAPGRPTVRSAIGTRDAIAKAVADLAAGAGDALVTAPINKAVLYEGGFQHPGHTEYLGELARIHWPTSTECAPVMMLASAALRVVPVTIHIPLAAVPDVLTTPLIIATVQTVDAALRRDFAIPAPRIALTGLNPHAGEDGALGHEEQTIIAPAMIALRNIGIECSGPHPADTIFHAAARKRYDVAVCMYHDQANIPIKALAFDEGVNCTLGLPFVRTSPDHGTAFDIAGQGIARPDSFLAALRQAAHMVEARRRHDDAAASVVTPA